MVQLYLFDGSLSKGCGAFPALSFGRGALTCQSGGTPHQVRLGSELPSLPILSRWRGLSGVLVGEVGAGTTRGEFVVAASVRT